MTTATPLQAFSAERPRLAAIARRLLGSDADVDDVLQEAWLRLDRTAGVEDLPAWATTVVTRLCLDVLRRRGTRTAAEAAVPPPGAPSDPEADALLADRLDDAVAVVLETLSPAERAAFVLHDVFGYSFDEVAPVLGRSATAVRQLASRARRKVQGAPEPPEERAARAESRRVVEAFLSAARGGDLPAMLELLAPDAVMRADLVGQSMGTEAAYVGADAVAGRFDGARGAAPVLVDGALGAAWYHRGELKVAFVFAVDGGRVQEVELVADPEVLAAMDVTWLGARAPGVESLGDGADGGTT